MLRAERLRRLGSCFVLATLAALAALGCDEKTPEEFNQTGTIIRVNPDTLTVFHKEPSLARDDVMVAFSTDWPWDGQEQDVRNLAVINRPLDEPYDFTGEPDTIQAAAFRRITFPTLIPTDTPSGDIDFNPTTRPKAQPVWDPTRDDRLAAMIQNTNSFDRIYLLELDLSSSDDVPVTNARYIGDPQGRNWFYESPAFSPDGRWLAYTRFTFRAGSGQGDPDITGPQVIYVVDLNTPTSEPFVEYQVSPGSSIENNPTFSPDGTRIAFSSNRDATVGLDDIYTIAFDPSNLGADQSATIRRLTFAEIRTPSGLPETNTNPSWSPSGGSIVFMSTRRAPATSYRDRNVWIMNADGTDQRILVFTRTDDMQPVFSYNDPNLVLFTSRDHVLEAFRGARHDIYSITDW